MAEDKKTTPEKWSTKPDARTLPGAGTYPNYYTHKTRSGHAFIMDDSQGAEHVTLQHRSGAAVQFMPDGAIQFTAHNGMYQVVFGENRMTVTGAQDITVNGGASLRVEGEYNVNAKKVNITSEGDMQINAKSLNMNIRGNMDVQAKNKTEKIAGSSASTAQGAMSMISKFGMTLGSTGDSVAIGAGADVGISAKGGKAMIESSGKTSVKTGGGMSISGTDLSFDGGSVNIKAGTFKHSGSFYTSNGYKPSGPQWGIANQPASPASVDSAQNDMKQNEAPIPPGEDASTNIA